MAEKPDPLSDPRQKRRLDTATLCSELAGVSDWRKLGLYLGVQDYELDQIERTHPTEGYGRWKQETFSLWLRCTPSASWRDVVGVLRRMGENAIAERIELKYIVEPAHASRPDTATLCSELAGVSEWRKLGLYLGVQDYELDQIERSYPTEGYGRWKQETFCLWLRRTPSASWRGVVGALRRMGENTIAERIELKYIVEPAHAMAVEKPELQFGNAHICTTNQNGAYLKLNLESKRYLYRQMKQPEEITAHRSLNTPLKLEGSDIATLCNELTSISDWFTLGLNLGVPYHLLKEVRSNYSVEGLGALKQKTLVQWLRCTPSASWRDVVGALQQMGENSVAERIQLKYIGGPLYASRPDTVTLCSELASVSDWHRLGLYLGVPDYELDQIKRSRPAEGCDGWKRETFSLWLRRTSSASWRDVVGALRRMRENTIAERIELKYIVGPAHASPLFSRINVRERASPPISPSGIGEARNAFVIAIAQRNSQMIKGKFSTLVTKSRMRLCSREISIEDFQTFLVMMYSSPGSRDGSYMVTTVLESAESLNEIMRAISKHGLWDYLNYGLLQVIIEQFASDDDELNDMMKQYQQDLTGHVLTLKIQKYLGSTSYKHPIAMSESDILADLESLPPQQKHKLFNRLSVMVDTNITEDSLRYVYDLWRSLAPQFELPRLSVILYDIAQMKGPTNESRNLDLPTSVMMSDEEAQTIVDQALESGSIKQRNTIAVVVGIVGSGKTWLIHRLFQINPPDRYTSTGVAEKSFRGLMHRIANMESWELLSQKDILEFLAPLLKAGLTKANIVSLAKTFTEVEVPQPTASSAETFTEVEALHPTPADVPSPSHSHAAVAQSEKSYASRAMTRLIKMVKGSKEAFIVEFLHMVDTGGQPEFIEVMPSLIHNSNLTLLVLNLAQSLDEYPPIDYHEDGRAFKRPLPSVLTNRQVIHQFARTLQAKRPTHTGSQPSMFTVIGTHRDCVKGELSETLAAVNKELKNIFLPTMEDELIVYRSHDEIIFPVNLLEPDDDDEKVFADIRKKISDANKVEETEVPLIPSSFFLFEQDAIMYAEQKNEKDRQVMVLSFDECVQIGAELKMNNDVVRAALIYFHRHNIFLYFQDVLPNLVFLAPQVPLDFVNAIVAFSYKVKSGAWPALKAKYVRFCNEGIITEEMLCDKTLQFSDCFVPGIYEPQDAIKLFQHIYTIAEEPLVESQQPSTASSGPEQKSFTSKREYLMMSLLADKKDIEHYLSSPSKVAPLIIHFSNSCVPNGCFGNVVSCLISKYNWKVCRTEDDKPECLAHNIVTLRGPKLPKATIVNYMRHLEIHVNMSEVKEKDFNEICSHIHTTAFTAIEKVFKVMRFEDMHVDPAFHCPCKCSQKAHVAKLCNISTGSSYLVCTKTGEMSQVQREHQFWLHHRKEGSSPPTPKLKDLINLQVGDWYRLGLALNLKSDDLDIIEEDHRGDKRKQTLKMFQLWLKAQPDASYDQLIKALHEVGCERVANSLCNKHAMYSLQSSSKDSSTKCSPSSSPERSKQHSFSSQWKHPPSSSSHKQHHIPRGWRSRSPEGGKYSSSLSSSKRRSKSRSHKLRAKFHSPRRSMSRSPPRKRSRSRSPRHSSSSRYHTRSRSPKSRRRSHYQSTHRKSHYRYPTSRSRSYSHSPMRRRTSSRSRSPHKQKSKLRSPRRSRFQSPSRKRSNSYSPRHNSGSRHLSRSQTPKSRRRQYPSWSLWERYSSGSPTSRSTSHSHSPKRSKSRSHSSRKHRSKLSTPRRRSVSLSPPRRSSMSRSPPRRSSMSRSPPRKKSMSRSPPRKKSMSRSPPRKKSRFHSPSNSSNSRHQSRSHSSKSHRRRSHSSSFWERYSSGSSTSRSTSHSHSPKRSKSRSHSSRKHISKSRLPRRSMSQSPQRRRSMSRSPQRRKSMSRSPQRKRSMSRSPQRKRLMSRSPQRRRLMSQSPSRKRSKFRYPRHSSSSRHHSRSQSCRRRSRSCSPKCSSSSRHRSRSQSLRSRRRPHFRSPHRRSRSISCTSRNTSHSHKHKRRSKPRSRSPLNH